MRDGIFGRKVSPWSQWGRSDTKLETGSRVAVIGGGPAGSFFSYFLLDMAKRIGLDLEVDIYEPRDFSRPGPAGCNMCGGIISESLVQYLAVEGINLPPTVVQRGIDSYMLHMDIGNVRIDTPTHESRIGAIHRGAGPRGSKVGVWHSFDGYLLELAQSQGANWIRQRVDGINWKEDRPQVTTSAGPSGCYDLLALAVGVNSSALKFLEGLGTGYRSPQVTKTYICDLPLGRETIQSYLGSSMHVFLLDLPRLEFAALIPKGDYVTACLLGHEIDRSLIDSFFHSAEVAGCLPPNVTLDSCHCSPKISVQGAFNPFADRMVFVGDCGVTRLYKDGIGAAYRTAKAAASTAVFEGVSEEDFRRHFWPACQAIRRDNQIGEVVFAVTRQIQKRRYARRGVLRMVSREQRNSGAYRPMSRTLWDTFTGSAPYRTIFLRTLHPFFLGRLLWETVAGSCPVHLSKPLAAGEKRAS